MYADDTVFYLNNSPLSFDESLSVMNAAAKRFSNWCDCNRLTINLKKSKMMVFSNRKNSYDGTISINGTPWRELISTNI